MNDLFFKDLEMPEPDYNLGIVLVIMESKLEEC